MAALKKLNREGQHARDIGKQLGRSEGAIRQYAYSKGVALRVIAMAPMARLSFGASQLWAYGIARFRLDLPGKMDSRRG
jgi:hypothetical protein